MPGLYSHTTRATGTVLTATIYNGDHENHITNQTPAMTDDYSANVTEMRVETDPGEISSESLATSLAGDIARLRYAITDIKKYYDSTLTRWYESPTALRITGAGPHAVGGSTVTGIGLVLPGGLNATGQTNGATLKITAPTTGATNNYSLWIAAGVVRSDGILILGLPPTTSAGAGEMVLQYNKYIRFVNYSCTDTKPIFGYGLDGNTNIDDVGLVGSGSTNGVVLRLVSAAAASLPVAGSGQNGLTYVDATNNRLIYYAGGNRYYLTGTSF